MNTPNSADRKQDRLPDGGNDDDDDEHVPIPSHFDDYDQAIATYQYEQFRELARASSALHDMARDLSWLVGRMTEGEGVTLPEGAADGTQEPQKTPRMQAEEELEEVLESNGIDPENVQFITLPDDRLFRLKAGDELSNDEGSPWREWTSSNFGKGEPGDIKWVEYENDDGSGYYPEGFEIAWDDISEVA